MIFDFLPELKALLSAAKSIVIVGHKSPDGDAIGSTLGLYHFLNAMGHKAQVIVPNDYPKFLKWMPGQDAILNYELQQLECDIFIDQAEIIFTLDFNALHRSGAMEPILNSSKAVKIMIDHHQQPGDYANFVYSDVSASSTCEMVYWFINELGGANTINADIASCLYAGIVTDTGSFKFSSTSSKTHRVVANLIEAGATNSQIHSNIFDTNSENRLQLLGKALTNLNVIRAYSTAYISLSTEELEASEFKKGDTEGFVNYGLSLEGVKFAVIFIEHKPENIIKISFRSKGSFSVNEFARTHFNGGGHDNAAGGVSTESLAKTIENFISMLPQYKHELQA